MTFFEEMLALSVELLAEFGATGSLVAVTPPASYQGSESLVTTTVVLAGPLPVSNEDSAFFETSAILEASSKFLCQQKVTAGDRLISNGTTYYVVAVKGVAPIGTQILSVCLVRT